MHSYNTIQTVKYITIGYVHVRMHIKQMYGESPVGPTHLQDGYLVLQCILVLVWETELVNDLHCYWMVCVSVNTCTHKK